MKIRVKYFGLIAEAVGKGSEEIELVTQPADLRAFFCSRYPALLPLQWKLAVDMELTEGAYPLHEGSEVVLLPPFAGG